MPTVNRGEPDGAVNACPECSGGLHTEDGETVCDDCGLVVDEHQIDHGRGSPFRESHRGPPRTATRHDRGLGTAQLGYTDAYGNNVYSARLFRMRREQSRAQFQSKAERLLGYGLTEIRRITSAMGQGERVVEAASVIFRRAQEAGLLQGRSVEGMAAGSVAAAMRTTGIPLLARDVTELARVDEAKLRNAYRVLNRELGLPTPPPTVADHVPRIASAVDLRKTFRAAAESVARQADRAGTLQGRKPTAAAAGCIYLVAVERGGTFPGLTQARLAEAADCTASAIRAAVRAIRRSDDIDLDAEDRR